MGEKILIPLHADTVAPRFDLASEVLIVSAGPSPQRDEKRLLILPQPSAEQLCHLILTEGIGTLICGGIDQEHYDYLRWKNIRIIDAIIGPARTALVRYRNGLLEIGDILPEDPLPSDPGAATDGSDPTL